MKQRLTGILVLLILFLIVFIPVGIRGAEESAFVLSDEVQIMNLDETGTGDPAVKVYLSVRPLLQGFDKKKHDIKLKSMNTAVATTSSKRDRIYAKEAGEARVRVKVKSKADGTLLFKGYLKVVVEKDEEEEFNPEAEQLSVDSVLLKGDPELEEIYPENISVYEVINGVKVFYSYASKLEPGENETKIVLFKNLGSKKDYVIVYDGTEILFTSGACLPEDVEKIEIIDETVYAGEDKELGLKYYNAEGMDITAAVEADLALKIQVFIQDGENVFAAYMNGRKLCILESGMEVNVAAELDFGENPDGTAGKCIKTEKKIKSLPKRSETFTGNFIYTLTGDDGKYLTWSDKCEHSVPMGDSVVLEALFEMGDGSTRNLKQAGVTLVVGDMKILMLGDELLGSIGLILNKTGTTQIVAMKDEEIVAVFDITVLEARKPDKIRVDLSQDHLNTNSFLDDYILIKADLLDQYGAIINDAKFTIEQSGLSKDSAGEIVFNKISEGRFMVNGYECKNDNEQKMVSGEISSSGISEAFKFFIRNIEYDSRSDEYTYKLEADGSIILNSGVGLGTEPPKSTFITTKITEDGYMVGEGIGYLFTEQPTVMHPAEYYWADPGEILYGISVEYTSENDEKRFLDLYDEECVIPSYFDLEFAPYVYGEKLPAGIYEVKVYKITAGEDISPLKECDSLTIRVLDVDPEVEVIQTAQVYSVKPADWKNDISKFFRFELEGEDISKYITKVDCVEAPSGSVFVRSVDFLIPNRYYGMYTKTVLIERLITKQ